MSTIRIKGNKHKYSVSNRDCIGRSCLHLSLYYHRAPMAGGGSMNTSSPPTPCCMNRAYRGCPNPQPEPTKELRAERKKAGYKNVDN